MEYNQILEYLYNRLPMFHRIGKPAYKANLENTIALSKHLGFPERKLYSIHIAGTNGKGSVAHLTASVMQEKGLKTGLCTSPHLKDFRERIKINGLMIPKEYICDFFNENFDFIEKLCPSFFELSIALTFKYFVDEKTDIAIIETGLGGRLDSTNIIIPLLSVITNIGYDHTDLLGDTLEKIAYEKAGIIKPNIPIIIGETQHSVSNVFVDVAKKNKSPIFFADQNFKVSKTENGENSKMEYFGYQVEKDKNIFMLESSLGGLCQNKNITTVLQIIEVLNKIDAKLKVSQKNISNGLKNIKKNTGLRGRWEILNRKPLTICDTGHNKEAFEMIINHFKTINYKQLHIVIGVMNDKKTDDLLTLLPKDAQYYFTNAHLPRAMQSHTLKNKATSYQIYGKSYDSVQEAYLAAQNKASKDDLIFIGGSTFIVAEVI